MSGHSKWNSIKRQKAAVDQKRGKIFTKFARAITVAAKEGGGDPQSNFKLRLAIDNAKNVNMPKDNIERAIKRGTGEGNESVVYEEMIYEGFGPNNAALIIKVLTDNKNRAVSELKHYLSKNGGSLGTSGSVMWQFDLRGVLLLEGFSQTEEHELILLESGALDYSFADDACEVITNADELDRVRHFFETHNCTIASAELMYLAKEYTPANSPDSWEAFLNGLDELEDIDTVFSNISHD